MPWVLDGNNLAGGSGRAAVRAAALQLARSQRLRIVVFFDGAPPAGAPELERLGAVEVRYVADADQAILTLLQHAGVGWRLATDDSELSRLARNCGAQVVGSRTFWEKVERNVSPEAEPGRIDLAQEIAYFERGSDAEPGRPRRVPRRRRRR